MSIPSRFDVTAALREADQAFGVLTKAFESVETILESRKPGNKSTNPVFKQFNAARCRYKVKLDRYLDLSAKRRHCLHNHQSAN